MRQCVRCHRWFRETGSQACDPCWEDMGQMSFAIESEDDYEPDIDSVFDRMEEQEGRQ